MANTLRNLKFSLEKNVVVTKPNSTFCIIFQMKRNDKLNKNKI